MKGLLPVDKQHPKLWVNREKMVNIVVDRFAQQACTDTLMCHIAVFPI